MSQYKRKEFYKIVKDLTKKQSYIIQEYYLKQLGYSWNIGNSINSSHNYILIHDEDRKLYISSPTYETELDTILDVSKLINKIQNREKQYKIY